MNKTDVIVIGGGIVGASTAYYLARKGIATTLLEKGRINGEQSSRNWGAVRQQGRHRAELPLMMACSREIWGGLEQELQAPLDWRRQGQMRIAHDEEMMRAFEAFLPVAREFGLDTEIITPRQISELLPHYAAKDCLGGMFTPSDGCADPGKVAPAFAAAARRLGAQLQEGCAALQVETQGGRVCGVRSEGGFLRADKVLVAAGAWSGRLLAGLGIAHPSLWVRGSVARSAPINLELRKLVVWGRCAYRQGLDGSILIADAADGRHDLCLDSLRYGMRFLPLARKNWRKLKFSLGAASWQACKGEYRSFTRHRVLQPKPDVSGLQRAARLFREDYPAAPELRLQSCWAGQIDFMPDELPVIDAATSIPGLAIAAGFSGHGFGLGPMAGRSMAALLAGGSVEFDLSPFRSERFGGK